MKAALALAWVAIAILVSLYFQQRKELIEIRAKAELAWMETQTMPYVKSYDHRDDIAKLREEINQLRQHVIDILSSR